MNILYVDHYAGSPNMGMEFRPYYLAHEWEKMGHKVTIMAGDYSHLRIRNPEVINDFQTDCIEGTNYVWIKTGKYNGNGVKRAVSIFRFVIKTYIKAKYISNKWKPNVVIASSTYPLDTFSVQRIAKKSHARYIHEVHDMWPSTLYEVGGLSKRNPFVMLMQLAENSAYKHCDKCVSLPPFAEPYMKQHGLAEGKFVHIQNGVNPEEWGSAIPLPEDHINFFKKYSNKFIVGYFGGHAISNALDNVLDIAKMVNDEDVIFVLVGDGVDKQRLIKRRDIEQVNNVFFLPPVSKLAVPELLKYFDCSIMTGKKSPLYRFGLSMNKMFDSMMAKLPIICVMDAPETLVTKYQCGIQCNPENLNLAVEYIMSLKKMSLSDRVCIGEKGYLAIQNYFTYEKLAAQFSELF